MKIARFEHRGSISFGLVSGGMVTPLSEKSVYQGAFNTGTGVVPLSEVRLLAPSVPSKIVAVGLNYTDHAKELGMPVPKNPILFIKPSSSLLDPGGAIIHPPSVKQLDFEAELAFDIKKKCKDIRASDAEGFILGYTCFNDVTARDQQKEDIQWTRAKSYDTFSPLGPWLVTPDELDPDNVKVQALVNGRIVQDSSTSLFIFKIGALLEFISGIMTLYPGDVVTTGTPPGVGPLKQGDTVTIRVEKIGDLTNSVRSPDPADRTI